ncbi:hypothetical protein SARC_02753 [Sphaeroforma arctica JP610]|uniref:tRNA-intron lyase n=1 Tax=Sphaeroforma arctica JP610 TaxID=667725 RepID=A0A0L0G7W1_9EUKA|nr:hypothetical protein SARC_02753 [Sphaeroforma arctica JP610]KNC85060.1 hypothetical protein SARC_02753 [Sphaeroforma arctica JP610]|eukprot:XP_014158962.1 hypothetical protein SARC_02753 [Sphaeroforma arctica JP610]
MHLSSDYTATPTTKAYSNKEAVSDAKTDVTTAVDGTKHAEPRKAKCLPPSDTLYAYTSDLGGLQSGDNSTSQPGGDTDMRTIEDRKFEQYKHTVGRIADDLGAHAVVPTENEAGCAVSTKTGHQSQDTVETGHVQSLVAGTGAVEKALIRAGDIVEREVLGLEETFYLVYGLQCLDLYREGNETPMTIQDVWTAFCTLHAAFIPRYTVYHHYRACGWVPRSGLKYATDFVLYKMGPIFTHSSYNVLIRTENAPEGFGQGLAWMSRQEGWGKIQNLQRMTEGVAKDTVLAWVLFPTTFDCTTPECLGQLQVDEYIIRRWRPEGT